MPQRHGDAVGRMDLTTYDVILINTSAGKDSLVMLDTVYALAVEQGVADRVQAVHCDLGRMEWAGTRDLAHEQCAKYGIKLHVVSRSQDLLDQVEQRGMWPSSTTRYCTSDHKRDQVAKILTQLTRELGKYTEARILNCMGLRAEESAARKKKVAFQLNKRATNGKRHVDDWLPIHEWTEVQVWQHIRSNGLKYHYAYDLGMPRLSCVFCIFAPAAALKLAGYYNRPLLDQYVAVEQRTGHEFQHHKPLIQIQQALEAGYTPAKVDPRDWKQCA